MTYLLASLLRLAHEFVSFDTIKLLRKITFFVFKADTSK